MRRRANITLWVEIASIATFVLLLVVALIPLVMATYVYFFDRKQRQHSVLRNYPILGRFRYLFEGIGPEMRQYMFDGDSEGKPFSRRDFESIVKSGKYASTVIGYGSKRDFDQPGFYVRNTMFPLEIEELHVDNSVKVKTRKYESKEALFSRSEHMVDTEVEPWLLAEEDAIVVGPNCPQPFRTRGFVGSSAMSFGALGDHAITAISEGLAQAQGAWMNTGEGGLSSHHLKGGVDIIAQIGPGLFGYRHKNGDFNWDELKRKAELPEVKMFELKMAQGAKIRGGHLPGPKVTPEIAAIRGLEPWVTVDSPNRFHQFRDVPGMVDFIGRIREAGGKPVGVKVVMGSAESLDELAAYMARTGEGPDFITVDGGEGGSGATYVEMADGMGLPIKSGIVLADNALRRYGVRDRVKLIASGKLMSADRIAVAMGLGADLVNIARGMMISVGCIGTQRCHLNTCPVGVATTDPHLQQALVVDEKRWRVTNFVVTLRHGLFTLAAAAGIDSPTKFERKHVVYRDDLDGVHRLDELFPYPEPLATESEKAG